MSALSIANPAASERRLTGGILFLLAGLAALGALTTNIILPAFPRIGAGLGVSSQEGLTLSSFFVAFALGQVLAGPLADRFGRKWLVLGGFTVFAAGSVVCAFANIARRIIDGAKQVNIFGEDVPVRARIYTINGFSAHADQAELLAWQEQTSANRTFLVHGEEDVMRQFAAHLANTHIEMPEPNQVFEL